MLVLVYRSTLKHFVAALIESPAKNAKNDGVFRKRVYILDSLLYSEPMALLPIGATTYTIEEELH